MHVLEDNKDDLTKFLIDKSIEMTKMKKEKNPKLMVTSTRLGNVR